ncbi:MAG: potassium channel family protein [Candidatus Aquicultorales bacterium]
MKILIMGCGRAGAQLARILTLEGQDVTVIDKDPAAFGRLGGAFTGKTVVGIGFDKEILIKAGVKEADAFVAVTNGDNHNMVGALAAKTKFGVPQVVARVYDPARERVYQHLGIQTISPTSWAANKIRSMILHRGLVRHMSFGNGEVELLEGQVPPDLAGHTVADLNVAGDIMVVSVIRYGKPFIPTSGTVFQEGDGLQVVATTSAVQRLKKMLFVG